MANEAVTTGKSYAGLFMVALSTLMYEALLTRIFSVSMWYHFAFMAISIAMFGMTVGSVIVYLRPQYFTLERAKYHLALSALLFAITMVLSFMTHLSIPFIPTFTVIGIFSVALSYTIISIPFVFGGICVSLALTKFPRQVSRLYAADLAGAALGCILLIYILEITDGPTAVMAAAALAALGSLFFAMDIDSPRLRRYALLTSLTLTVLVIGQTVLVQNQSSLLRLMWVKGGLEEKSIYEKWNSFSRIKVFDDLSLTKKPFGWGLSSEYHPTDHVVEQHLLNIDATAATVLTRYSGNPDSLDYLKYDVTNVAHYIRPNSNVLVVGVGGGRDVLSALVFGQKSIRGVEINDNIIGAITGPFAEFTGHLDKDPRVLLANDEARSYIARSKDSFDIIQVSLIDTWAATSAGAFALTESSLYTVEAWKIFMDHLSRDGVLTFSRWYFRANPAEVYRITSLATATLLESGISDPRKHIAIVRNIVGTGIDEPDGIGTIMVSKTPFSDAQLDSLESVAARLNFGIVLSPRVSMDSTFTRIASGTDLDGFTSSYPLNIAAPTDNSPFFFHMLRLGDVFTSSVWRSGQGGQSFNMKAVLVLGVLLAVVIVLTGLCIIVPLALTTQKGVLKGSLPLFLFFSAIGFGFMLVEVSQMQRLTVFLGHPVYGLAVVLFALLLSSGLGSYTTTRLTDTGFTRQAVLRMGVLLVILIVFGLLTPYATAMFQGSVTPVRILVAVAMLFPLGVFMGMAFPIGMKAASGGSAALTPWLWGINGATSVCASVFAVAISLSASISASYWTGFAWYGVALLALVWNGRRDGARV